MMQIFLFSAQTTKVISFVIARRGQFTIHLILLECTVWFDFFYLLEMWAMIDYYKTTRIISKRTS